MSAERSRGVFVLGASHRSAPVALRERLAFGATEIPFALRRLRERSTLEEAVLLSTCNRLEIYGASIPEAKEVLGRVLPVLAEERKVEIEALAPTLYVRTGREAVEHLFRVASSLDSLVVGETQISGQVREAYELACRAETVGFRFHPLFRNALRAAGEVRRRTRIGEGSVSIASVAIDLAKKIFSDLGARRALVVGGGEMAELCLRHLLDAGVRDWSVANRGRERAETLALHYGGKAIAFSGIPEALEISDIVLVCLGASAPTIGREFLRRRIERGRRAPLFFIDISVPRGVDPSLQEMENVFLYNVDDLGKVAAENRLRRAAAIEGGARIVAERVELFERGGEIREIAPDLAELRTAFQGIGEEEAEMLARRLQGKLDPRALDELRRSLRRSANRIFHRAAKAIRDDRRRDLESYRRPSE